VRGALRPRRFGPRRAQGRCTAPGRGVLPRPGESFPTRARELPLEERTLSSDRASRLALPLLLLALIALALAWRTTQLAEWLTLQRLVAMLASWQREPAAPLLVLLGFLAGSLLVLPLNLLILATVLGLGAWPGALYAFVAGLIACLFTYGLGRLLGRERLARLLGPRAERARRALVAEGIAAVAALRMTPIAPFTVINVLAGAGGVDAVDFAVGSALGLLPGVLGLSLLGGRLLATLHHPTVASVSLLAATGIAVVAMGVGLQRLIRAWRRRRAPDQS